MSPELDEQTATDAESTVTCAGQALTPNSKTMTPPRMTPQGLGGGESWRHVLEIPREGVFIYLQQRSSNYTLLFVGPCRAGVLSLNWTPAPNLIKYIYIYIFFALAFFHRVDSGT